MKKVLTLLLLTITSVFAEIKEFEVVNLTPQALICREMCWKGIPYDKEALDRARHEAMLRRVLGVRGGGVSFPSTHVQAHSPEIYYIPVTTITKDYKVGRKFKVDCTYGKTFTYKDEQFTVVLVKKYNPDSSVTKWRIINKD